MGKVVLRPCGYQAPGFRGESPEGAQGRGTSAVELQPEQTVASGRVARASKFKDLMPPSRQLPASAPRHLPGVQRSAEQRILPAHSSHSAAFRGREKRWCGQGHRGRDGATSLGSCPGALGRMGGLPLAPSQPAVTV